jgi:LPS O-antigen subunit length determinant protein (WzzB/FepE family)
MTGLVPQLLSARAAAQRCRVPWQDLRRELEARGYRVVRICGRERVSEQDLAALIEAGRQPTGSEGAARVKLALARATEELGLPPKRQRRSVRAG